MLPFTLTNFILMKWRAFLIRIQISSALALRLVLPLNSRQGSLSSHLTQWRQSDSSSSLPWAFLNFATQEKEWNMLVQLADFCHTTVFYFCPTENHLESLCAWQCSIDFVLGHCVFLSLLSFQNISMIPWQSAVSTFPTVKNIHDSLSHVELVGSNAVWLSPWM